MPIVRGSPRPSLGSVAGAATCVWPDGSARRPQLSRPIRCAVLAVGPLAIGVVTLVVLSMLINSWLLASVGFLIGLVAGAAMLASLLYHPATELLPSALSETDAKLHIETSRLQETVAAVAELNRRLTFLDEQRRELATSRQAAARDAPAA